MNTIMSNEIDNLHFLQDYVVDNIHRSLINEAVYNPRVINDQNYKDLKRSLKKIHLREPLIWNKQTGTLVGGHQRLRIMDEEWERKNGAGNRDYKLTVVVLDIPLKEEIELNIAFNNPRLMGDYDIGKMNEILSSDTMPTLDFDIAGIKDEDLEMFGINMDLDNITNDFVESAISDFESIKEQKKEEVTPEAKEERIQAVKDTKKGQAKNEVDTYVTITFSSQQAKHDFMERIEQEPKQLFIKGELLVKKLFSE